jgi:hypothetical protein
MHKTWILVETDEGLTTIALLLFEFRNCDSSLFYYEHFKYDNREYRNFDILYFDILRYKFWKAIDWVLGKIKIHIGK